MSFDKYDHFGRRIERHLPIVAGESCCIPISTSRKLAALLFDKQYLPAESFMAPKEVSFCNSDIQLKADNILLNYFLYSHSGTVPEVGVEHNNFASLIYLNSLIAAFQAHKVDLTPLFSKSADFDNSYVKGDAAVYHAIVENVPLVDDEDLSWEQVLEFRSDEEAKRKYRDFRVWLSFLPESLSISQATDIVGQKLDDYNEAIKKHGLRTRIGAYKSIIDWREQFPVIAAAIAGGLSGGTVWAAIAAGSVVLGKALVYVEEQKLALQDVQKNHREVALIQEIKSLVESNEA